MLKNEAVRGRRTAATRAAAGVVAGQALALAADEEALLLPEWTGTGAFTAALVAALTFAWLLLRWRRARALSAMACCPGAWRAWTAPARPAAASSCGARRCQRPPHRRRAC